MDDDLASNLLPSIHVLQERVMGNDLTTRARVARGAPYKVGAQVERPPRPP